MKEVQPYVESGLEMVPQQDQEGSASAALQTLITDSRECPSTVPFPPPKDPGAVELREATASKWDVATDCCASHHHPGQDEGTQSRMQGAGVHTPQYIPY